MPSGLPDPVAVLRGHTADVQALHFDETENYLWTGDASGEVRAWSLQDLRPVLIRRLHPPAVGVLNLRLLGQHRLLTQGRDGVTHLWALGDSMQLSEQPVHSFVKSAYSFCRCSVMLLDGATSPAPASGSGSNEPGGSSGQQQLSAAPAPEPNGRAQQEAAARTPPSAAEEAALGPPHLPSSGYSMLHECVQQDGQPAALLAIADDEGQDPEVWCCSCSTRLAHLPQAAVPGGKLGMVLSLKLYCAAGQPHSVFLAAGYENGSLVIWDLGSPGAPVAHRKLFSEPVMALDVESGGGGGLCGAAEDKLVGFTVDYASGSLGIRYTTELRRQGINDASIRPDSRISATAGWDSRVRLYKFRAGKPLAILKYHSQAVTALAFSGHSMMLATASRDGTIALWDIYRPGSCDS